MKRPVLLEVTRKAFAPEILAAFKNGKLDIRMVPKGSGSYLIQAWALAVYGPGAPGETAYGTALHKVGWILKMRGMRPQADPGGSRMHPGTTHGGVPTFMSYQDTPQKRVGTNEITERAREAAAQTIEELTNAGYQPINGSMGEVMIALSNILNAAAQMAALKPQAPAPAQMAAEGKTLIRRQYVIEDDAVDAEPQAPARSQQRTDLDGPPAQQIGDKLHAKMARDLANVAKDMLKGQKVRVMHFQRGNPRTAISISFEGINDEKGLPVAYLRAVAPTVQRGADGRPGTVPYALVKIFHDVDNATVTKSPGKVVFADIEFEANRGHTLAQLFTKWVDDWVPIHNVSTQADRENGGRGDARRGATMKARAHQQFTRLPDDTGLIDLRRYGFTGDGPLLARLMVSPIVKRVPNLDDDELVPFRVFSLHRTMPEGSVSKESLANIEEEVLIGATVAFEQTRQHFTAFGLVFADQFKGRETKIMYALLAAIVKASTKISSIPRRFNSPLNYDSIKNALTSAERGLWKSYGSDEQQLNNQTQQQSQRDAAQERVNDEVSRRLMVDDQMGRWYPDQSRRQAIITVSIDEVLSNPRRVDITKPDKLLARVKELARARRYQSDDEDDEDEN